jgi:hypothetical protein
MPVKGEMHDTTSEPFKAPHVASLSVRAVVDSFLDQFLPKATHPSNTGSRFTFGV